MSSVLRMTRETDLERTCVYQLYFDLYVAHWDCGTRHANLNNNLESLDVVRCACLSLYIRFHALTKQVARVL